MRNIFKTILLVIFISTSLISERFAYAVSYYDWEGWAYQQGGFWDAQKWMAGDFDGDGIDDIANVFYDNGAASIDVHLSTGVSFGIARWATRQGGFWDEQKWLAGDFNGDGIDDIANVFYDNGAASIDVHLSTGASFGIARWVTRDGWFHTNTNFLPDDVNGDGKADIVSITETGYYDDMEVQEYESMDDTFLVGSIPKTSTYSVFFPRQYRKLVSGDYDGDNNANIAIVYPHWLHVDDTDSIDVVSFY